VTARKQKTELLTALPNIGTELARCLVAAGIESPEQLRQLVGIEAALRIAPHRPSGSSCRSVLFALAGAIRGIRWHDIPKPDRDALRAAFEARAQELA